MLIKKKLFFYQQVKQLLFDLTAEEEMEKIPADKSVRINNEVVIGQRQFSDFPFNPELRKYLQNLYKEWFFPTRSGDQYLVRLKKMLAFGQKGIGSIELYMVWVYFQGDLLDKSS